MPIFLCTPMSLLWGDIAQRLPGWTNNSTAMRLLRCHGKVCLSFAHIVTNPRIFERPSPIDSAWKQIETWLDCPVVRVPVPGERHREILGKLIRTSVDRATLIPDAHLAALAIENGFILCSTDGDFARFPELQWRNPSGTGGRARLAQETKPGPAFRILERIVYS
jgi:toxin-antitoxin system PIN domain toxin